ncbi:hypothetical protein [Vibrio alginolyticus]|uniref:hypothetical protein n=1 Tax=Vibrio alginolyticus TaxID=663 RepID=UPI001D6D8E6A|nr:hypothetical protein [Vibrio alginolyticus]MBR9789007.1 hypothetical protein [Vibrionaceae bacterium]MCS0292962.1 hypothetical protein [Vibrio alginolyticus]
MMTQFNIFSFSKISKRTNRISILLWGVEFHSNNLFCEDLDLALQEKAQEYLKSSDDITRLFFEELRIAALYELAKHSKIFRTTFIYKLISRCIPVSAIASRIAKEALESTNEWYLEQSRSAE